MSIFTFFNLDFRDASTKTAFLLLSQLCFHLCIYIPPCANKVLLLEAKTTGWTPAPKSSVSQVHSCSRREILIIY